MAIQLGSAYGKVTLDSSGVGRGVRSATTSLRNLQSLGLSLSGTMQDIGASMTVGLTLPIALAGKKAFDVFREFEQSLNILKTVSHANEEEMKQLSDRARELGADLTLPGTSAADAADAMAELAKAGLNVNEILAASRGVLQLSVAGQISNAEAARITANALNAFGLEGSEAARVADLLAASALASTAEVDEMADSLQMAAAVAAMSGMRIEELITDLGLMANAGIQGSDAGTSVKQMLLALQTPSNKAKDLMRDLGINIYDAAGNLKSMRELIKIFTSQLGGLTMEQRNNALGVIFGSDAIRSANIVLMGGVAAYDKMSESVNKAGASSELAASMMQGLTGELENIKSAFETASIAAIEPFKDDLKTLLHFVAEALNKFSALPEPIRKMVVMFLLLVAATGPLLLVAGKLLGIIVNLSLAMETFGITLPAVGSALTGTLIPALVSMGTAIWAAVVPALAAVGAALLPILAVLAAVILFIGLFALAWKTNFLGIRDNIIASINFWKAIFKSFFAFLRGDTEAGMEYLKEAFNILGEHISKVFEKLFGIRDAWGKFLEWMRTALGSVVTYISNAFTKTDWSQLGRYVTFGIANGMLFGIPMLILAATKAVKAVIDTFDKALDAHSPSKTLMKRGVWSGQGYLLGLQNSMDPNAIARMLAKPIANNSSSSQQNITMQFASGLTINQVQGMIAQNNEALIGQLNHALGGG